MWASSALATRRPLVISSAAVERSAFLPPSGGPLVESSEQLTFGKVLPPLPHLNSHPVREGRVLSFRIPPPHGPAEALLCLLLAGSAAGPGSLGSVGNLFDELQAQFDAPPEVEDRLVDAFRPQSHPPIPPSGNGPPLFPSG